MSLQARREILSGKARVEQVVRTCLVVAKILNKKEVKWLTRELNGYKIKSEIPSFRTVASNIREKTYGNPKELGFEDIHLNHSIHFISAIINDPSQDALNLVDDTSNNIYKIVPKYRLQSVLDRIIDHCLTFLNDVIIELQYGGIVEYLMEEIRKNTDAKLISLNPNISNETQSLFNNLTSTNKADWNKVGHSCRKLLKLVADKIFPASNDKYKFKDGSTRLVKDNQYINRICAFIDQKTSGYERSFILSEINYFEKYLREINKFDNIGVHKESIEKYQADRMAIHTYLIISEILRHYDV